jgi:hypothetical protein
MASEILYCVEAGQSGTRIFWREEFLVRTSGPVMLFFFLFLIWCRWATLGAVFDAIRALEDDERVYDDYV